MTDQIPAETAVRALRAFFPTTSVEWFDGTHIERMRAALAAGHLEIIDTHSDAKHCSDAATARNAAAALETERAAHRLYLRRMSLDADTPDAREAYARAHDWIDDYTHGDA